MKPRAGLKLIERPAQVEAALWRRLRDDEDARCREMLFDRFAQLARAIARGEFRRRPAYGLERADFEQLAFGGLLEAIDRYDPLHGAPFEAYARPRIRGAIADGVARSSEGAAQFNARRRTETERLQSLMSNSARGQNANAIAALAELAGALAIGVIAENATLAARRSGGGLGAYEGLAWRDMQIRVLEEIDELAGAEKTVMQQHYLNDVPFNEIARLLGLSKGRIAQIHRAALARLRVRLRHKE
jgi:RNA polymerase sigma factor for flagellar operon FliA